VVVPGPLSQVQRAVLDWAAAGAGRDLPWRHTRDPWAILVSEVMLQQTQVARVIPVYRRFLERFPTLGSCASAGVAEVVKAWAGLGYNRRAVNLHRTATAAVERYGGRLPADRAALQALPGIGPYTARAVLAFAFEADVGLVEANSARVLARAVVGRGLGRKEAQALADSLVPCGAGWVWNSALIDLGATVCTLRSPRCSSCPLAASCAWSEAGRPEPDPARGPACVARTQWPAAAGGRQPPFAGSERQGRGRLVAALRHGPIRREAAAQVAGWPGEDDRAGRVVAGLLEDGLAVERDGWLTLP
jgi:A/G-specific adenine glycosylase